MSKNPTPMDVRMGAALYFWRRFDGLTQRQVANRGGFARYSYTLWENSRQGATVDSFARLAHALNVSPYILALTMEALG